MLISWLRQALQHRQWDEVDLAQVTGLDEAVVKNTLAEQTEPDFNFCIHVAQALEKQPERLLHMAGHLSDAGLHLAIRLAGNRISQAEIYRLSRQVSVDERRLILRCAEHSNRLHTAYRFIRPGPHEFNSSERKQDRIRFATIVVGLLGALVIGVILGGVICNGQLFF